MTDAADVSSATPARRWQQPTLVGLWVLIGWFLLTDFPRNLAVPDIIDMSWRGVLTYAAEQNWQWGKKIVFTYGPLGFVHHPVYTAESWWKSLTYQGLRSAVYLLLLWRVGVGLRHAGWRWPLWISAVFLTCVEPDAVHMLLVLFTGLLLVRPAQPGPGDSNPPSGPPQRLPWDQIAAWLGLVAVIFGAHIKVTFLLHAAVMLVFVGGELALARRWRAALLPCVVFLLGYLLTWVTICGQALGNLPAYLHYGLNMAEGFSDAMGLPAPAFKVALGLALGAAAGVLVLLPLREKSHSQWGRHWGTALLGLATLYLVWKQTMVRWDVFHAQTLLGVMLPMMMLGLDRLQKWSRPAVIGGVAAGMGVVTLLWQFPYASLWVDSLDKANWLKVVATRPESIAPAFARGAAAFQLPAVKAEVGSATIDMISLRESILTLNGLNYHPAPVFQGYAAFTPELIDLNTKFYQSAEAPQYVLYMVTRLDQRMPSADNAGVLLELLKNYTPVLKEDVFVLFKRTPRGPVEKTLVSEGELASGQVLPVPETREALWCELESRETALGKLYKMVLHRPAQPLDIIEIKHSERHRFGLVPPMAGKGFLLYPLIYSPDVMIAPYDPEITPPPPPLVIGFHLDEFQRALIQPRMTYRFYKLNLALDPAQEPVTLSKIRELRQAWEKERLRKFEETPNRK